jgi:hypothetical protein
VKFNNRSAMQFFKFGTELLGKVPRQSDGPLDIIVKGLAIADAWQGIFGRKTSTYSSIFERYELKTRKSEPFVKLFFDAGLGDDYRVSRHGISDHLELIEAVAADGERLFFQEHRYGSPELAAEFFYTPRFDFASALSSLWGRHRDGIYLSLVPGKHGWGHEASIVGMSPDTTACLSRKAGERAVALADSLRAAPRTLLLYGPPGTGKTSLAAAVAKHNGGRLLKVDAACLPHLGVQELGFLLDALAPRYLLIDDFDRSPIEEARSRVLYLFERIKAAGVASFVTVNDASKMDAALLRSGRIDGAIELPLPDAEERADILLRLGLIGHDMIEATEGWCHADLDALAERSRREPVTDVLDGMRALRELAAKASGATAGEPGCAPCAPGSPPS